MPSGPSQKDVRAVTRLTKADSDPAPGRAKRPRADDDAVVHRDTSRKSVWSLEAELVADGLRAYPCSPRDSSTGWRARC
jgi:hypothetical protein